MSKLTKYFTYVQIPYSRGIVIDELWRANAGNLDVTFNLAIAEGKSIGDPRVLGSISIEVDESGLAVVPYHPDGVYDGSALLDSVLQVVPHTLESVAEAIDKIYRWTGITCTEVDGEAVFPAVDMPLIGV